MNELEFRRQFTDVRLAAFCVMQSPLCFLLFLVFTLKQRSAEEIWEQDLSLDMQIGASTEGYEQVALRCGAEKMVVELSTSQDFSGVIYTQGSFHSKQSPCFLDLNRGGSFTMNVPFDQCATENVGDKYRNILIVQQDDELVTPGDAAFILECDFSKPRDLAVSAELNEPETRGVRSSISLVDADPGRDEAKRAAHVESGTERVVFVPNSILRVNDEL